MDYIVNWLNQHMQTLIIIISLITVLIILRQVKIAKRHAEIDEKKATLSPDVKISKMHGSEGVNIIYDIVGRAELPIRLEKITFNACDRNDPKKKYPLIEQVVTTELAKDGELHGKLLCPREKFETDETKNLEQFEGYRLFTTIAGEFSLHYRDYAGNRKEKCIEIDKLM